MGEQTYNVLFIGVAYPVNEKQDGFRRILALHTKHPDGIPTFDEPRAVPLLSELVRTARLIAFDSTQITSESPSADDVLDFLADGVKNLPEGR